MTNETCWDCEHGKHLNGKCQRHDNSNEPISDSEVIRNEDGDEVEQ
jgi:hypothetical protein